MKWLETIAVLAVTVLDKVGIIKRRTRKSETKQAMEEERRRKEAEERKEEIR